MRKKAISKTVKKAIVWATTFMMTFSPIFQDMTTLVVYADEDDSNEESHSEDREESHSDSDSGHSDSNHSSDDGHSSDSSDNHKDSTEDSKSDADHEENVHEHTEERTEVSITTKDEDGNEVSSTTDSEGDAYTQEDGETAGSLDRTETVTKVADVETHYHVKVDENYLTDDDGNLVEVSADSEIKEVMTYEKEESDGTTVTVEISKEEEGNVVYGYFDEQGAFVEVKDNLDQTEVEVNKYILVNDEVKLVKTVYTVENLNAAETTDEKGITTGHETIQVNEEIKKVITGETSTDKDNTSENNYYRETVFVVDGKEISEDSLKKEESSKYEITQETLTDKDGNPIIGDDGKEVTVSKLTITADEVKKDVLDNGSGTVVDLEGKTITAVKEVGNGWFDVTYTYTDESGKEQSATIRTCDVVRSDSSQTVKDGKDYLTDNTTVITETGVVGSVKSIVYNETTDNYTVTDENGRVYTVAADQVNTTFTDTKNVNKDTQVDGTQGSYTITIDGNTYTVADDKVSTTKQVDVPGNTTVTIKDGKKYVVVDGKECELAPNASTKKAIDNSKHDSVASGTAVYDVQDINIDGRNYKQVTYNSESGAKTVLVEGKKLKWNERRGYYISNATPGQKDSDAGNVNVYTTKTVTTKKATATTTTDPYIKQNNTTVSRQYEDTSKATLKANAQGTYDVTVTYGKSVHDKYTVTINGETNDVTEASIEAKTEFIVRDKSDNNKEICRIDTAAIRNIQKGNYAKVDDKIKVSGKNDKVYYVDSSAVKLITDHYVKYEKVTTYYYVADEIVSGQTENITNKYVTKGGDDYLVKLNFWDRTTVDYDKSAVRVELTDNAGNTDENGDYVTVTVPYTYIVGYDSNNQPITKEATFTKTVKLSDLGESHVANLQINFAPEIVSAEKVTGFGTKVTGGMTDEQKKELSDLGSEIASLESQIKTIDEELVPLAAAKKAEEEKNEKGEEVYQEVQTTLKAGTWPTWRVTSRDAQIEGHENEVKDGVTYQMGYCVTAEQYAQTWASREPGSNTYYNNYSERTGPDGVKYKIMYGRDIGLTADNEKNMVYYVVPESTVLVSGFYEIRKGNADAAKKAYESKLNEKTTKTSELETKKTELSNKTAQYENAVSTVNTYTVTTTNTASVSGNKLTKEKYTATTYVFNNTEENVYPFENGSNTGSAGHSTKDYTANLGNVVLQYNHNGFKVYKYNSGTTDNPNYVFHADNAYDANGDEVIDVDHGEGFATVEDAVRDYLTAQSLNTLNTAERTYVESNITLTDAQKIEAGLVDENGKAVAEETTMTRLDFYKLCLTKQLTESARSQAQAIIDDIKDGSSENADTQQAIADAMQSMTDLLAKLNGNEELSKTEDDYKEAAIKKVTEADKEAAYLEYVGEEGCTEKFIASEISAIIAAGNKADATDAEKAAAKNYQDKLDEAKQTAIEAEKARLIEELRAAGIYTQKSDEQLKAMIKIDESQIEYNYSNLECDYTYSFSYDYKVANAITASYKLDEDKNEVIQKAIDDALNDAMKSYNEGGNFVEWYVLKNTSGNSYHIDGKAIAPTGSITVNVDGIEITVSPEKIVATPVASIKDASVTATATGTIDITTMVFVLNEVDDSNYPLENGKTHYPIKNYTENLAGSGKNGIALKYVNGGYMVYNVEQGIDENNAKTTYPTIEEAVRSYLQSDAELSKIEAIYVDRNITIKVNKTDENGNLVVDKNGNPVLEEKTVTVREYLEMLLTDSLNTTAKLQLDEAAKELLTLDESGKALSDDAAKIQAAYEKAVVAALDGLKDNDLTDDEKALMEAAKQRAQAAKAEEAALDSRLGITAEDDEQTKQDKLLQAAVEDLNEEAVEQLKKDALEAARQEAINKAFTELRANPAYNAYTDAQLMAIISVSTENVKYNYSIPENSVEYTYKYSYDEYDAKKVQYAYSYDVNGDGEITEEENNLTFADLQKALKNKLDSAIADQFQKAVDAYFGDLKQAQEDGTNFTQNFVDWYVLKEEPDGYHIDGKVVPIAYDKIELNVAGVSIIVTLPDLIATPEAKLTGLAVSTSLEATANTSLLPPIPDDGGDDDDYTPSTPTPVPYIINPFGPILTINEAGVPLAAAEYADALIENYLEIEDEATPLSSGLITIDDEETPLAAQTGDSSIPVVHAAMSGAAAIAAGLYLNRRKRDSEE